jgi:hypothetical protein
MCKSNGNYCGIVSTLFTKLHWEEDVKSQPSTQQLNFCAAIYSLNIRAVLKRKDRCLKQKSHKKLNVYRVVKQRLTLLSVLTINSSTLLFHTKFTTFADIVEIRYLNILGMLLWSKVSFENGVCYELRIQFTKLKLNSVALVRERTIPTERLPPVGEVSANFCG